jgi:hypothetical protein
MTFEQMIAIVAAYFGAVFVAAIFWKAKPHPPEGGKRRPERMSFSDFHRSQLAKPIRRETSEVYSRRRSA